MSTTTESSVAANTSETQGICTQDSNDSGSAEPEGAQIIMTVPEKVEGKVLESSVNISYLYLCSYGKNKYMINNN